MVKMLASVMVTGDRNCLNEVDKLFWVAPKPFVGTRLVKRVATLDAPPQVRIDARPTIGIPPPRFPKAEKVREQGTS
jgi:hypothetical protein